MYEIWLGINIIYEWCLLYPMVPLMMFLAVIASFLINKSTRKNWRTGFRPAFIVAMIAFAILFFVYPMLIKSSASEMAYFIDWVNHLGICLGLAGFCRFGWSGHSHQKCARKSIRMNAVQRKTLVVVTRVFCVLRDKCALTFRQTHAQSHNPQARPCGVIL
jgi:hypothetical protein